MKKIFCSILWLYFYVTKIYEDETEESTDRASEASSSGEQYKREIFDRKSRRMERDLSLSTTSNLWILSVAVGFMGIQCLNWKIIGQCLEVDRSARNPLLNAYNRPPAIYFTITPRYFLSRQGSWIYHEIIANLCPR